VAQVVGPAIIGDLYASDRARLPKAMAFNQQFAIVGVLAAPTLGGLITELGGWRAIFAWLLLLGGAVGGATYAYIPETLNTAKESRPQLSLLMPLHSIWEGLGERNVAIVCLGIAVCHGTMFLNQARGVAPPRPSLPWHRSRACPQARAAGGAPR
jgi:DHA1 family bicyclomycin/chloramphenicol resistance-like MFS transporter